MNIFQNDSIELDEFRRLIDLLQYYQQIDDVFKQFDTNNDQRISFSEFKKGFQVIGDANVNEENLRQDFNTIDSDRSGYIQFDEVHWFDIYDQNNTLTYRFSFASTWQRNMCKLSDSDRLCIYPSFHFCFKSICIGCARIAKTYTFISVHRVLISQLFNS